MADQHFLDRSVTVVVRRKIAGSKQREFEQWAKAVIEEATKFPGHLGATVLTPEIAGGLENILIFRFDNPEHLAAWDRSETKDRWLAKIKDITVGEVEDRRITGLEYWFHLPNVPTGAPPPRRKMVVVTILAVYPLSLAINGLFGPRLVALPLYARTLVVAIALVMLMTYVAMPNLVRLFKPWLYPARA
jgi:uncharacterized protein